MATQADAPYAALVRETRIERNLTQDDLAREVGCPQQTIEKIERGVTKKSGYLPAIFKALGLDLALLTNPRFPIPPLPADKIEGPKRTPVTFYVKEWRKFCEAAPAKIAKALNLDTDDYNLLENKPYRFSIEQLVAIADELKIQFDSMRWNPERLPAPQPARKDIERINKGRGRK